MRTAVSALDIRRARSLSEALEIIRDESRVPVAGATDVYVGLNFGTLAPRAFVDIWGISELRRIDVDDGRLVIGALSTYTDVIRSPAVASRLPMLIDAARQVGGPQIQNRGTIGGNIANASPAGDSLPVLLATDATVAVRSFAGERRVPLEQFFTGYRATVLRPDELIVAIEVPAVQGKQWFRKVGTRAAQAISKIVIAGVRGSSPRVALGSVAPTVVRARDTERLLAMDGIDDAASALANEIHPIDDLRSTAEYRRRVAVNLLRRFWRDTA